jgi:hypothetical protein
MSQDRALKSAWAKFDEHIGNLHDDLAAASHAAHIIDELASSEKDTTDRVKALGRISLGATMLKPSKLHVLKAVLDELVKMKDAADEPGVAGSLDREKSETAH